MDPCQNTRDDAHLLMHMAVMAISRILRVGGFCQMDTIHHVLFNVLVIGSAQATEG